MNNVRLIYIKNAGIEVKPLATFFDYYRVVSSMAYTLSIGCSTNNSLALLANGVIAMVNTSYAVMGKYRPL